jgi:hypothetical protein
LNSLAGLNKQITELQYDIQRNQQATGSLSEKLNAKLDSERHHLFEIESGKRNFEIKVTFLNLFYFLKRVLLGYEDKPSDLQISM